MPARLVSVLRRSLRRRWRLHEDRGATAIELAIVAPVVMILIVGGVQAALSMFANTLVLAAAQQGADAGRLYDAPADAGPDTASRFLGRAAGRLVTDAQVSQEQTPTTVTVTITARTVTLIPGPWSRIAKTASGPREIVTGGAP
ncbi:hypothetical protein GCM10010124_25350 [Pilimelia terevasa]|uniref:TadE-like domain-containing protein n=1 Tax=Pilimelia terevasa TaxID=53372 RepID=A0A8J3BSR9_9ACTN|nr:TadE family protein [Pilimelia terevasa]GGK31489.1 hypothetical protein GCM10010124_25350 [Pilimelia terevasa]